MKYYIARAKDAASDMWLVQDIDTGEQLTVSTDEIKKYMGSKRVNVINLQIDAAGRLIKQGQFKFNKESFEGLAYAPKTLLRYKNCELCDDKHRELFETSMDIMFRDIMQYLVDNSKGFIQGRVLDADRNLICLAIKTVDNLIRKDEWVTVLVRYEQAINCVTKSEANNDFIWGDVLLGVRAIRFPNGQVVNYDTGIVTFSKYVYEHAGEEVMSTNSAYYMLSDEISITRRIENYCGVQVNLERPLFDIRDDYKIREKNNGHLFIFDGESELKTVANSFMHAVGEMLVRSCENTVTPEDCKFALERTAVLGDMSSKETSVQQVAKYNSASARMGEAVEYAADKTKANAVARWAITAGLVGAGIIAVMNGGVHVVDGALEATNWYVAAAGMTGTSVGLSSAINAIDKGNTRLGWHDVVDTFMMFIEILASAGKGSGRRHHRGPDRGYRPHPGHGSHSGRR